MSSYFTFALVILIITLILFAFSIANMVYYNKFKSGVALTSNQLKTLKAINIIAIIIILVAFIYAIFAMIQARRVSTAVIAASAVKAATPAPAATAPAPAPVFVSVPAAAPPAPVAPVAAAPVASVAAAPVAPVAAAPAVPSRPTKTTVPPGVQYAGKSSDGIELYSVKQQITVEPGQYLCVPNNTNSFR